MGKLFSTTKNGSETLDKNLDHHKSIAIIAPKNVPSKKPIKVSKQVTFKCSSKLFCDRFRKVFSILLGWLIIKLSIIPLLARTSHNTINPITMLNWTIFITIFSVLFLFKYFLLSFDIVFSLFMYIQSFPYSVKVFTKLWTFSTI